jgi:hypothetical protein
VVAGLAQASQRLGRTSETKKFLEEVFATLPGTVYAARAKKWVDDPTAAAKVPLTCQTCHDEGRLKNRLAQIDKR